MARICASPLSRSTSVMACGMLSCSPVTSASVIAPPEPGMAPVIRSLTLSRIRSTVVLITVQNGIVGAAGSSAGRPMAKPTPPTPWNQEARAKS